MDSSSLNFNKFLRPPDRKLLTKGQVSAKRPVLDAIERPEYVGKSQAASDDVGPYVQSAEVIEKVRIASKIAAIALQAGGEAAKEGVSTDQVDAVVHEALMDHHAYPSTLEYLGYPKSCCTSLNEVICHGIPDSTVIEAGDILNIDVTAYIHGVHGDTNATFMIGEVEPEVKDLVKHAEEAMWRGVAAAKIGREVNVVGRVIEKYAARHGYETVRDFTGHGIAAGFHNGLIIPHYDSAPLYSDVIEENMIFTVEPMITLGKQDWDKWDDDWTILTKDKSFTAQFEHTFLITDQGYEVLTDPNAPISIA